MVLDSVCGTANRLLTLKISRPTLGAHQASCAMGTGSKLTMVLTGPLVCSDEVGKELSCILRVCCDGMRREKFT